MYLNENDLLHVTIYGNKKLKNNMNVRILITTIRFTKDLGRFGQHFFFTNINTILIPSYTPFLNFLFKKSVVLQVVYLS